MPPLMVCSRLFESSGRGRRIFLCPLMISRKELLSLSLHFFYAFAHFTSIVLWSSERALRFLIPFVMYCRGAAEFARRCGNTCPSSAEGGGADSAPSIHLSHGRLEAAKSCTAAADKETRAEAQTQGSYQSGPHRLIGNAN